jgi:hypothetical protein
MDSTSDLVSLSVLEGIPVAVRALSAMLRLIWCLVKWTLGVGTWISVPRTFRRTAVRGGLKRRVISLCDTLIVNHVMCGRGHLRHVAII